MGYILVYVNVLIIALAMSIKLNKKIDLTIFLSIALISEIEYIMAIIFNLQFANKCNIILTIICISYLIYKCIKDKSIKKIYKRITPGLILLTVLYIMLIVLYNKKMVISHNELGAWALRVKNMNYFNSLPKNNSNMLYVGYPPMTAMWHYWFSNFFGEFKDGNLYISSALLQFSIIIAITNYIKDKSKIRNIAINITFITMLFLVSYIIFTSLFVDAILGLLFVLSIIYILKIKRLGKTEMLEISLILIFLNLTKETGVLFVVVSLFVLTVKEILNKENNKINIILKIIVIALILFGINSLWGMYLKCNDLHIPTDTSGFNITELIEFFKGKASSYRYDTIINYISYLLIGQNFSLFNINVSAIAFFIITVSLFVIVYIKKRDKEARYLMLSLLTVNVLFLVCLLAVYLFVFSQWEAEVLSAITRYIQTLNVINICFILFVLYTKCKYKTIIISVMLVLGLSGTNRCILELTENQQKIKETIYIREKYNKIEEYRDVFNEEDKIYLVSQYNVQDDENLYREIDLVNIRYQITPFKVYMMHSNDVSQEEIINKLSCEYTYIFFYEINKDTVSKYKFLLIDNEKIERNSLFKLYFENDKLVMKKVTKK